LAAADAPVGSTIKTSHVFTISPTAIAPAGPGAPRTATADQAAEDDPLFHLTAEQLMVQGFDSFDPLLLGTSGLDASVRKSPEEAMLSPSVQRLPFSFADGLMSPSSQQKRKRAAEHARHVLSAARTERLSHGFGPNGTPPTASKAFAAACHGTDTRDAAAVGNLHTQQQQQARARSRSLFGIGDGSAVPSPQGSDLSSPTTISPSHLHSVRGPGRYSLDGGHGGLRFGSIAVGTSPVNPGPSPLKRAGSIDSTVSNGYVSSQLNAGLDSLHVHGASSSGRASLDSDAGARLLPSVHEYQHSGAQRGSGTPFSPARAAVAARGGALAATPARAPMDLSPHRPGGAAAARGPGQDALELMADEELLPGMTRLYDHFFGPGGAAAGADAAPTVDMTPAAGLGAAAGASSECNKENAATVANDRQASLPRTDLDVKPEPGTHTQAAAGRGTSQLQQQHGQRLAASQILAVELDHQRRNQERLGNMLVPDDLAAQRAPEHGTPAWEQHELGLHANEEDISFLLNSFLQQPGVDEHGTPVKRARSFGLSAACSPLPADCDACDAAAFLSTEVLDA